MTWYRYWASRRDDDGVLHVEQDNGRGHAHASPRVEVEQPGEPQEVGPAAAAPAHDAGLSRSGPGPVLVVANQKGGVGKTTTAVSVAAALARRGWRVLLTDLDPQGNATSGLGVPRNRHAATVYDVLIDDTAAADAVLSTAIDGLDVLPSSLDLAGAEIELVSAFSREQKLARALTALRHSYDVILVDCPPSLGLLTVNALTAGDAVLVPIQCEYYALEGLRSLHENIDLIRLHLNPSLEVLGYVMTMHDGRTRLSEQVVQEVERHFGDKVLRTRVPRSVRLAEAPSYGQPITVFDPGSRGAVAYVRVADEICLRLRALSGQHVTQGRLKGASR